MKTITKLVRNLNHDEYIACSRLRLRESGRIAGDLKYHMQHPRTGARVVMIKDDDTLASWGLIDYSEGPHPVVQLYTRTKYRRRGLGARVVRKVKSVLGCNEFICFPHDDTSANFFRSQNIKDPRVNEADGTH